MAERRVSIPGMEGEGCVGCGRGPFHFEKRPTRSSHKHLASQTLSERHNIWCKIYSVPPQFENVSCFWSWKYKKWQVNRPPPFLPKRPLRRNRDAQQLPKRLCQLRYRSATPSPFIHWKTSNALPPASIEDWKTKLRGGGLRWVATARCHF